MPTVEMLTTGDVARFCKVNVERLRDLIRRGKIKEPPRIGGRRVWTAEERDAARDAVRRN